MTDDDLQGWTFHIRERSAGGHRATGMHLSGASVGAVGSDPEDLLAKLGQDARDLRRTQPLPSDRDADSEEPR